MFCVLQIYPVDKVGAQHYSWEEFVEKISVDEYEDGEDLSPLLEELAALHEHPFTEYGYERRFGAITFSGRR